MRVVGAILSLNKNTQWTLSAVITKAPGEKCPLLLFSIIKELDVRTENSSSDTFWNSYVLKSVYRFEMMAYVSCVSPQDDNGVDILNDIGNEYSFIGTPYYSSGINSINILVDNLQNIFYAWTVL